MRNTVQNVIEMLTGAILIGLGLIYLAYQYKSISKLTDRLTQEITEDKNIIKQSNTVAIDKVTGEEICAAIMGYRDYPIMVDGYLIPIDGYDFEAYFSYIKDGIYKKQYNYNDNRKITMIIYTYTGT